MPTIVTRYINTASSGGNGTTNATSGANAAYSGIAAWNSAEAKNLVTADESHIVICSGGADTVTAAVDLAAGWTTDTTRTLTIKSEESRSASTFASGYRIVSSSVITVVRPCSNVTFQNIRISHAPVSGTTGMFVPSSNTGITIKQCWLRHASTTTTGFVYLYIMDNGSSVTFENTIFDSINNGTGGVNTYGIYSSFPGTACTAIARNCTFTGFISSSASAGVIRQGSNPSITLTNCVLFNNDTDVSGTGVTVTYSASDDTLSGTGNVDISPGGSEPTDWNNAVTDYANGDYTVKNTSSVLYNSGTDLTGSGITVDLIGTTRPQGGAFDIGAFELSSGSGTASIVGTPTAVADGGSYTAESGSNRVVVWVFGSYVAPSGRTVTGCTFGGVSMTSAGAQIATAASTVMYLNVYYLKEADIPSGSQTLDVTWSGTMNMSIAYAFTLQGVSQTTPVVANTTLDAPSVTSATPTGMSVTNGDIVIGLGAIRNNKGLSVSGYTEYYDAFVGIEVGIYSKQISSTGTETPTLAWDGTTQDAILKFVAFGASAASGTSTIAWLRI